MNYDVIIAGGGVNGCGIARDLAWRGIKCLLLEKNDFSAGTSCASSGMIHGGPRYLFYDKDVTRLSCLDSGYIQRIAPHLLFRIPFIYPLYREPGKSMARARLYLEGVESFFEAYDRFVPLKNGKPHTRLTPDEAVALEPDLPRENLVGAITFDEWGIDVPRLCIANAVDAVEHGATALNHREITRVIMENGAFRGVEFSDTLTGAMDVASGKILINATGPWSPKFAAMAGVEIKLRVSKGVHLVLDRRLCNVAIATRAIDGREIFILPYENNTVIGTTDDDYFGDLDDQRTTEDEIKYLLDGIEAIFPSVRASRVIYSYSGVRPTLYRRSVNEDDLSREHELIDHEERDGVGGVISLIGGKLASYRIMAEETADLTADKLGVTAPCRTHDTPLPGGDDVPDVPTLARDYGLDPFIVARLTYRHGSRVLRILESIRLNPRLGALVCGCEPVTEAEIRYVMEWEMARTLADVRRRTRFSLGPCQGTNCVIGTASVLRTLRAEQGEESAGLPAEFSRYLDEWWYNRSAVLNGDQIQQEELFQAVHFCNNSLDVCKLADSHVCDSRLK